MAQGVYTISYKDKVAYVGSGRDTRRRFNQHRDTLRRRVHRNFLLQRIWDKHGDVFTFSVLEEVENAEMLAEREQFYMDTLKPWANLSQANGSHLHTEETKQKMRRTFSEEHLANLRAASALRRGRPNGRKGIPTGRVPRSAFQKGLVPWNLGTKGVMVSWSKGKKLSPEHRAKLSLAKLGKPKPESARLALIGRKQSPETIAKRVAAFHKTIAQRKQLLDGARQ